MMNQRCIAHLPGACQQNDRRIKKGIPHARQPLPRSAAPRRACSSALRTRPKPLFIVCSGAIDIGGEQDLDRTTQPKIAAWWVTPRWTTLPFRAPQSDLPSYCAPTFTLVPVGSKSHRPVQALGFNEFGHLPKVQRFISASCTSGQRFAIGLPQTRSHPRKPALG